MLPEDVRAEHEADWLLRRSECSQHGGPLSECNDPDRPWYPQRRICRAAMESAAANALYEKLHTGRPFHDGTFKSWAKERSREYPYHYSDGVTIFAAPADLDPDDDFLSR